MSQAVLSNHFNSRILKHGLTTDTQMQSQHLNCKHFLALIDTRAAGQRSGQQLVGQAVAQPVAETVAHRRSLWQCPAGLSASARHPQPGTRAIALWSSKNTGWLRALANLSAFSLAHSPKPLGRGPLRALVGPLCQAPIRAQGLQLGCERSPKAFPALSGARSAPDPPAFRSLRSHQKQPGGQARYAREVAPVRWGSHTLPESRAARWGTLAIGTAFGCGRWGDLRELLLENAKVLARIRCSLASASKSANASGPDGARWGTLATAVWPGSGRSGGLRTPFPLANAEKLLAKKRAGAPGARPTSRAFFENLSSLREPIIATSLPDLTHTKFPPWDSADLAVTPETLIPTIKENQNHHAAH